MYPSWQRCGVFIVNELIQIRSEDKTLLDEEERYILYQTSWARKGRSLDDDSSTQVCMREPFGVGGLTNLLSKLKNLLTSNYPPACLALGGTVMSLGYQRIVQLGGSCPVVLLYGDTETAKTTVLKACLSLTGNSDIKDYTGRKALQRSKSCDIPFAWDDPSSQEDVKFIVQAVFNQAGKETVHSSGVPRSLPIITANFACKTDKRAFSRQAIILFGKPDPLLPTEEMRKRKKELDMAASEASSSIAEALNIVEQFTNEDSTDSREYVSKEVGKLFPNKIRSTEIYSKLMWFTIETMKRAGFEEDVPLVWNYLEEEISPFIMNLFKTKELDTKSLFSEGTEFEFKSLFSELEALVPELSANKVGQVLRTTRLKDQDCLAIAYMDISQILPAQWKEKNFMSILKSVPGAIKSRLRFPSGNKGTTMQVVKQCYGVPVKQVPPQLFHFIKEGKKDSIGGDLEVKDGEEISERSTGVVVDEEAEEDLEIDICEEEDVHAISSDETPERSTAVDMNTCTEETERDNCEDLDEEVLCSNEIPERSTAVDSDTEETIIKKGSKRKRKVYECLIDGLSVNDVPSSSRRTKRCPRGEPKTQAHN